MQSVIRSVPKGFRAAVLAIAVLVVPPEAVSAADYRIEVELDPETHRLTGRQQIRWRNASGAATDELYLHLYLNAFANTDTSFMRELDRPPGQHHGGWGWTRIDRLQLDDGTDLLSVTEVARPDDGNPDDFTLVRVPLPYSLSAGGVVELEVDFEAQLPRIIARTGYADEFHFAGQWFPKIAYFDGSRGWNAHQFHATSEFFADFGEYRVAVTVPETWVVGASGWLVGSEPVADGRRVDRFRAEQVHDFAWAAAPGDQMEVVDADFEPGRDVPSVWLEAARDLLDRSPADLELPPLRLRLLVPRSQAHLAPRMVRAARLAVAWFGLRFGPYPYPQLTIVSPPPSARAAGGMEYPTLITTGADSFDAYPPFSWSSDIEGVTVHEFGHQYFQGLVASNEFEEAWLDEGVTTYVEASCLADITAASLAPPAAAEPVWLAERLSLARSAAPLTVSRPGWQYRSVGAYFTASYSKAALVFGTLERLIGPAPMARGLRAYVEDFRFQHPTGADLEASLSHAAGTDLSWFFDQAIAGDAEADWGVLAVEQRRREPIRGVEWDGAYWTAAAAERAAGESFDAAWRIELDLVRRGEFVGPVEVELLWSDGETERRVWNDDRRWVRWRFDSRNRLEQVVVDPDGDWLLETRRADNYWRDAPAAALHPLWWVRSVGRLLRMAFLRFG
jgi:hypothetical protein